MGTEFLLHGVVSGHRHSVARLPVWRDDAIGAMKRLRLGAVLHFIIAIGHLGCLFALDEAFDGYGIKDMMHNMVFGHVWMLYALTIGLALVFTLAGLYALSASGDIRKLPLTRTAIIVIIVLYSLRTLAGGWACVVDLVWCYYPGLKKQ